MEDLTKSIMAVRAGDQRAYTSIVLRFQDMAIGYARAILGDSHLAEDAAQEAFIEAYVEIAQLRELATFPGWFRRIVHKRCDRIHRRRRLPLVPLEENQSYSSEGSTQSLEEREQSDHLQAAIQKLPLKERALITLFYLRQFTLSEVAAFLEIPESTANNRLHRARKHLRKELFTMTENRQQSPTSDNAFVGRVQEQIEALTTLHDAMTTPLIEILSKALQSDVEVRITSVNHTLAFKVVQWFPYPSCTYSFQPEGTQQRVFFDVNMELAAAIVGRDIGIGDAIRAVDLGQISNEEFPKMHQCARRIMGEIIHLWDDTIAMEVIDPMIETSPVLTIADPTEKIVDAEDPVFHVKLEIKWNGHLSYIELCYPSPSLAAGLARLQSSMATSSV